MPSSHIGRRSRWQPRRVLVTGAGPIGLLAALLARQRGFEVSVPDRATDGPKPAAVAALDAEYVVGDVAAASRDADVVIEAPVPQPSSSASCSTIRATPSSASPA